MTKSSTQNFSLASGLHWLLQPGSIWRGFWIAVGMLHVWLVISRVMSGDWATIGGLIKSVLCLAAIFYATLKVLRVATLFDRSPRRALVFALVLILGHTYMKSPMQQAESLSDMQMMTFVIEMTGLGLGLGLLLVATRRRTKTDDYENDVPVVIVGARVKEFFATLSSLPPRLRGSGRLMLFHLPPPTTI